MSKVFVHSRVKFIKQRSIPTPPGTRHAGQVRTFCTFRSENTSVQLLTRGAQFS